MPTRLVALAVCALFDAAGERLIRGLWAWLEPAGIGSLASHTHAHPHPHLSNTVLREWEFDRVRDTLGRLPDGRSWASSECRTMNASKWNERKGPPLSATIVTTGSNSPVWVSTGQASRSGWPNRAW